MNKPISMIIKETNDKLIATCNESGLPACILELIVKNIYNEVNGLSEKILDNDKKSYNESLESVNYNLESSLSNAEVIE